MQLEHHQDKFQLKKFPIIIICDKIRTPENIGMALRLADAFGVEKIVIDENSPSPEVRSVKRVSRYVNKTINYQLCDDVALETQKLKQLGYTCIALEITSDSKPIHEIKIEQQQKVALIIGAERTGISPELLNLCTQTFHITMYGNNSSMNVINSLAIALYEITQKFNLL